MHTQRRRPRWWERSSAPVGIALSVLGLWTAACDRSGETPAHEAPTLRVEYAGCETVYRQPDHRGPVCVLPESRGLRLWVGVPLGVEIELAAAGRPLTAGGVAVQGGLRFDLAIPDGAGELAVRAAAPGGEAVWTLALADSDRPAWFGAATEALRRADAPEELEAVRQLLEEKAAAGPAAERGLALSQLARVEMRLGAAAEAAEILACAVAAHRAAGSVLREVQDATTLVWLHVQQRRLAKARAILEALRLGAQAPAETRCWRAYYQAVVNKEVGDSRSALTALRAAAEQAERVDMDRERRMAEEVLGSHLQVLGRSREAAELFARLLADPELASSPCDRARLLNNQAWSLLLAREAGAATDDPVPPLEEARRSFERRACGQSEERIDVEINLALAHLQHGRPRRARVALRRAEQLGARPTVSQKLWWLDLEGRIALGDGRPEAALALYSGLAERAVEASAPDARWRAAVGRARSLEVLGNRTAAFAALAEAEELLSERSLQVPLDEGRESFVAQREAGTRLYLDLLLADGREAEAFAVARRARSRMLRGLRRSGRLAQLDPGEQARWARAIGEYRELRAAIDAAAAGDWQLPADEVQRAREEREARRRTMRSALDRAFAVLDEGEVRPSALPAPRPGEVVLAYHPLPSGWVGFAAVARTVTARRFELPAGEPPAPGELAARLLEPFAAEIQGARRVRILPYGSLREVDFHALPFGDDVLLAARPVVYGLDIEPPQRPLRRRPRRALIVADPRGDLPASRREAATVRRLLATRPEAWDVELLEKAAATAARVSSALPGVDLLHYAGHGVFAGRGGWESALPLAGRTRLTVGDLLTLEGAPRAVVLSGCETARSAPSAIESIGLAHAFLLVGASHVIAAVRPVGDRAAGGLVTDLYREWNASPDSAELLRRAQLAWRRREPGADWASFRALEP